MKAWQKPDGSWAPVRKKNGDGELVNLPFILEDFYRHLDGEITLGHYMVDQEGMSKLFAFDIDLVKDDGTPEKNPLHVVDLYDNDHMIYPREAWLSEPVESPLRQYLTIQLRCLADGLAQYIHRTLDMPVAIANSGGKGLHVYCFTGSMPADVLRELMLGTLEGLGCFEAVRGKNFWRHTSSYPALEIETFPKQGSMDGKEFGNLMRLPLGINRKSGKMCEFIRADVGYDRLIAMDPMRALSGDLPWE